MPYFLLVLCALLLPAKTAIGQEIQVNTSAFQELVVQVRINGTDLPDPSVVLFGVTNDLYAQEQELSVWRIDSNGLPTIELVALSTTGYPLQRAPVMCSTRKICFCSSMPQQNVLLHVQ
jgi:hypothetical protein